jgi:hypothetical protein
MNLAALHFDDGGIPVIGCRRSGVHLVIDRCPLCGQVHRHGARGGYGHRAAHCPPGAPGSRRGYRLVKLAEYSADPASRIFLTAGPESWQDEIA